MKENILLDCIKNYKLELINLDFIANNYSENKNNKILKDEPKGTFENRVMKIAEDILYRASIYLGQIKDKNEEDKILLKKIASVLDSSVPYSLTSLKVKISEENEDEDIIKSVSSKKNTKKNLEKKDDNEENLEGTILTIAFGIGKLINLSSYLYEKYQVLSGSTKNKEALDKIFIAGTELMPTYTPTIIDDIVEMIYLYAFPDIKTIKQIKQELNEAKQIGENNRKNLNLFSNEEKKIYLDVSNYAYEGINLENDYRIRPLRIEELPMELQVDPEFYNSRTGILNIPGGMKVLFGKYNNKILISFAGTELINKIATLGTDIQQLLSPNLMYLRAVGIVSIMRSFYPENQEIIVTGHSLGGGLTQAAILANTKKSINGNLKGITFNSVGLSKKTLDTLLANVEEGSNLLFHCIAEKDLIPKVGALIGSVNILRNVPFPYHCISNLRAQIY